MEITTYNFKTYDPKKNFYQNSKINYQIKKNHTKLNSYIRNLNKLSLNNMSLKSSEEDNFLNNYESELNHVNKRNKIIKTFKKSKILGKLKNENKNNNINNNNKNRTKQSYDSFNKFLNQKLIKNLKSPIKILNNIDDKNRLKNSNLNNKKSFSTGKNNNNNNNNIVIPKLFITSTNLENENTLNYTISNNFNSNYNNNNNNIFSPSKSITSYNFYTPFNKRNSRNSHHTQISSFFSTLNTFNIKKLKLKFLTKEQIKKKYPKKNFQKIFKELDNKTLQTEEQQKIFYNKTFNVIPYTKVQDEKLIKEQKEMEDLLSSEREKKPVEKIAKTNNSGYISMLNKNICYLMEFGDNYLKFSDENFYPRRKEILKKYETIQQNAEVDVKNEKIINNPRIKTLDKNHLILIKKFYNLKKETKEIEKMKDNLLNEKNNNYVNKNIYNKKGY